MFNPYDMEEYAALMTIMSASIESFETAVEEECTEAQRKRLRIKLQNTALGQGPPLGLHGWGLAESLHFWDALFPS
jgi:hypothetical protein